MEETNNMGLEPKSKYEGVKGWLLIFCFALIVLSPLGKIHFFRKFLEESYFLLHGAGKVFGWSFYSQGGGEENRPPPIFFLNPV